MEKMVNNPFNIGWDGAFFQVPGVHWRSVMGLLESEEKWPLLPHMFMTGQLFWVEGKLSNSLPLELLVLDMHSSLRREAGSSRSSLVLKKEARLVAGEETCANLHGVKIKCMCASSLFLNAQLMVDGNCWFPCVLVNTASIPHISKKLGAQESGDESKNIPLTSL